MKFFTIALFTVLLRAQEPAGVIHGSVRDAASKLPIAGAEVYLESDAPTRNAATSATGDFRFEKLPSGDYSLAVHMRHYLDSEAAFVGQALRLKAGAVTESVTIELTPMSSVEGSVLGEDGRPLAGVTVHLGSEPPTVGDDGHYRIDDIEPGNRQVSITVPDDLRDRLLVRDPSTGATYGYAATQYYPGVDDARLATPLIIAPGAQLHNVDVRLRRTLLADFTGHLLDAADAEVALVPAGVAARNASRVKRRVDSNGAFRFALIQPGHYDLLVYRTAGESAFPYVLPLDIPKSGFQDLPVAVPPFARIQGIVKPPDIAAGWQGSLNIRLRGAYGVMAQPLKIPADGAFTLDHIPPGEYRVFVEQRDLRQPGEAGRKLFVEAIRLGSQSVLAAPLTITEGGNPPLEIVLSDKVGRIAGQLTSDEPGRAARATILVQRVEGDARRLADVVEATAEGAFQVPDLPPGDYELTAWPYPGNVTGTCEQTATVTVKPNAAAPLTMRICK